MNKLGRGKLIAGAILSACVIALIVLAFFASARESAASQDAGNYAFLRARVLHVSYDDVAQLAKDPELREAKQEFTVRILDGQHKGQDYDMRNTIESVDVHRILVAEGDVILVNYTIDQGGNLTSLHLYEIVREQWLYVLAAFLALSLIIVCGIKGAKTLLALVFTGFMVIGVLMPLMLAGYPPLPTTLIVLAVTVSASLCLLNGMGRKTLAAALGTIGGLAIAAIAALLTSQACKITGLANNDAQMIAFTRSSAGLDFQALLYSAIIVGALGAAMDVAVSISSALAEIQKLNPDLSVRKLILSGMRIGRDIMGPMATTLILAYLGGSFSLFLLFIAERTAFTQAINLELVSSDIITAISGSLGIVWTIPITVISTILIKKHAAKRLFQ